MTALTERAQIEILSTFTLDLYDHINDNELTLTTSGIEIKPGWQEWSITAHCADAQHNDVKLTFTATEAAAWLEDSMV